MADLQNMGYGKDDFQRFMEEHHVAALAVLGQDWPVMVTSVFYAVQGPMSLLIKTNTSSFHGKAMLASPRVALSIYDDRSSYLERHGAQLRGTVERIYDPIEMEKAVQSYMRSFPGSVTQFDPIPMLISEDAENTLFKIDILAGKMMTPMGYSSDFEFF